MKQIKVILIIFSTVLAIGLVVAMSFLIAGSKTARESATFNTLSHVELVSDTSYEAKEVTLLDIDYEGTPFDIILLESDDELFHVKEYLAEEEHKATISSNKDRLVVKGPQIVNYVRNIFTHSYYGYIEIYVPTFYKGEVSIRTTSGDVESKTDFKLEHDFVVKTSSGEIKLANVDATNIQLNSTSGEIEATQVKGTVRMGSSSGSIVIGKCVGEIKATATSGDIRISEQEGDCSIHSSSGEITLLKALGEITLGTTSGDITLDVKEIAGNIELRSSSGEARVSLPDDAEFEFDASTSSGDIRTSFDDSLSFNSRGNNANGSIGENPKFQIDATATSGDLSFSQK